MIIVIVPGAVLAILFLAFLMSYIQYLRHRAPLKAVDPSVTYGYFHHVGIVTIPLIKYRLQAKFKSSRPATPAKPLQ